MTTPSRRAGFSSGFHTARWATAAARISGSRGYSASPGHTVKDMSRWPEMVLVVTRRSCWPALRSSGDERGRDVGSDVDDVAIAEPRQDLDQRPHSSIGRQLDGEVTQQADQLSETLASPSRVGDHRPGQRTGAAFPHVAVATHEELVAHVAPALRRTRVETRTLPGSATPRCGRRWRKPCDGRAGIAVARPRSARRAAGRRPKRRVGRSTTRQRPPRAGRPATPAPRSLGRHSSRLPAAAIAEPTTSAPAMTSRRSPRRSTGSHTSASLYDSVVPIPSRGVTHDEAVCEMSKLCEGRVAIVTGVVVGSVASTP